MTEGQAIAGGEQPPAFDRVTVSEAARRIGRDKSVVSRDLRKFGLAPGADGRFSFATYAALRGEWLNEAKGHRAAAAEPGLDVFDEPAAGAPDGALGGGLNANKANAAKNAVQAALTRFRLEREKGNYLPKREVLSAVETLMRHLRDNLGALPARLAGELAALDDPAEIRRLLGSRIADLLKDLADGLRDKAGIEE